MWMSSSAEWLWGRPTRACAGWRATVNRAMRHVGQVESANQVAFTFSFDPDAYQPFGPTTWMQ